MQRLGCVCVREPLWYLLSELGESVGLFGLVKLFYLGLPGSLESKALASACPAGRFVFTFVPALLLLPALCELDFINKRSQMG